MRSPMIGVAIVLLLRVSIAGERSAPVASVENLRVLQPQDAGDGLDLIPVRFRMVLRNTRKEHLRVARVDLVLSSAEILSQDGTWKAMFTDSWYGSGSGQVRHEKCTAIPRGKSFIFLDVEDR